MTIRSIPIRNTPVSFKLYRPEESRITISVRRDNTVYGLGQEITPTVTITNTGTRTLTDITLVSDELNFNDIIVNSLSSGQSYTYTMSNYSYLVDESTILDGLIVDFSVSALDTLDDAITDSTTYTYSVESPRSTLSIVFTPDSTKYAEGDTITPEITITNTGNLTLYNIECTSNLTDISTSLNDLAPNDSDVITIGSYDVTSSDVTAGSVYCDATVTSDTPDPDNPDVSVSTGYSYSVVEAVTLTINYLYSDNTVASSPYVMEYSAGSKYRIYTPPIEGYTADIDLVSGTIVEDTTINVVYTQIKYTLTIYYKDQHGYTLAPTYTGEYAYKEAYRVTSPVIEGYIANRPTISGTMPARDYPLTVTYSENQIIE